MSYIAKNGRLYTSGASEALTLLDDKFSVNKSYSKGDSCIYNDYLWKFTSDKPAGEWDSSVVEQCRIMDFVDDINGRLTQIKTVNFTDITAATQGIRAVPNNIVPKNAKVIGINGLPSYDYFTWYHSSNGDVYLIQFSAGNDTRDTVGGINVNISYIED